MSSATSDRSHARGARSKRIEITCPICLGPFTASPSEIRKKRAYCSNDCRFTAMRARMLQRTCPRCGKEFHVSPRNPPAVSYCSRRCQRTPPTRIASPGDLAYAAGIFDGEGTVSIGSNHILSVVMVNTHEGLARWFQSMFGGQFRMERHRPVTPNRLPSYAWATQDEYAADFLRGILPHLIVKREEAQLAIEYRDYFKQAKEVTMRAHAVAPEDRAMREGYRQRLLALRREVKEAKRAVTWTAT